MSKKILLHIFVSIVILGIIGFGAYEYITLNKEIASQKTSSDLKDLNTQNLMDSLENCQTTKYTSTKGYFSLVIPTNIYTQEFEDEANDDGYTIGGTYFSFDKDNPQVGLLVIYSKPSIEGKGGSCVDDKGEGAYKDEVIAGQSVEVCEEGGFDASYFKNPTREIEYEVTTSGIGDAFPTPAQIEILKNIVRTSLAFN